MSLLIHNAILMPAKTFKIFCTDGLESDIVSHIENLLNFGGKIVLHNCGAQNEFKILKKAVNDM